MSPCPFCGSTKIIMLHKGNQYWMQCEQCYACGPLAAASYNAFLKWEMREDDYEKDK